MSKNQVTVNNGKFSSNIGFILSCVGSAVGMANIWMFPYRLGQYGGAAFLIPYLFFVALFGYVGLSGEFAMGRLTGVGTVGSYEAAMKNKGKKGGTFLGSIPLLGSLGIAIGYAVIVGWVFKYTVGALTGEWIHIAEPSVYFSNMTGAYGNMFWHTMVFVLAVVVLYFGTAGIEKANKIMMPTFFVLFVIIMIKVATLDGAMEGYRYLLIPDWTYLLRPETYVMAMGQAFFSLSITGSGMIIYGSYMKKNVNIVSAAVNTAIFDTIAALVAAFTIIPAVFAFGMDPGAGPPLLFITLPKIFQEMPGGQLFSVLFFVSILFAGITSLVNMLEVVIESAQLKLKLSRNIATFVVVAVALGVGYFIEFEPYLGQWMDIVSIYVIPFGAVIGAIMIFICFGSEKITAECNIGAKKPVSKIFGIVGKYVYVPLAGIVFILGCLLGGIG